MGPFSGWSAANYTSDKNGRLRLGICTSSDRHAYSRRDSWIFENQRFRDFATLPWLTQAAKCWGSLSPRGGLSIVDFRKGEVSRFCYIAVAVASCKVRGFSSPGDLRIVDFRKVEVLRVCHIALAVAGCKVLELSKPPRGA